MSGLITVNEFLPDWLAALELDVDVRTEDNYRRMLRLHIQSRWGDTAMGAVTGLAAQA